MITEKITKLEQAERQNKGKFFEKVTGKKVKKIRDEKRREEEAILHKYLRLETSDKILPLFSDMWGRTTSNEKSSSTPYDKVLLPLTNSSSLYNNRSKYHTAISWDVAIVTNRTTLGSRSGI